MYASPLENIIQQEYQTLLGRIEPPGRGCHPSLIQPARKGVRLGLSDAQIMVDLRTHIPPGDRRVADSELRNTVRTARNEEPVVIGAVKRSKRKRKSLRRDTIPPLNQKKVFRIAREIIQAGGEQTLAELSPINVAEVTSAEFVRRLYRPDDWILLGDTFSSGAPHNSVRAHGRTALSLGVAPRDTYLAWLLEGNSAPLIWPQTFTGVAAKNKDGKDSYRCDSAVAAYRHCIIEFDDPEGWPLERQHQFWAGVIRRNELPVVAVVYSGNKSLHAWLQVNAANQMQWKAVTDRLLHRTGGFFGVLKADPAGKVPSQGFRLPGHLRAEKKRRQALLYFNPAHQTPDNTSHHA